MSKCMMRVSRRPDATLPSAFTSRKNTEIIYNTLDYVRSTTEHCRNRTAVECHNRLSGCTRNVLWGARLADCMHTLCTWAYYVIRPTASSLHCSVAHWLALATSNPRAKFRQEHEMSCSVSNTSRLQIKVMIKVESSTSVGGDVYSCLTDPRMSLLYSTILPLNMPHHS